MLMEESKLLARGAEAKVYDAELLGRAAIVKRREAKKYRVKELDESLRRSRTKSEARIMLRAAESGVAVPTVFYVNDYDVWMEKVYGALLQEKKIAAKEYVKIGSILADLHNAGIAHGDFTPANIIVRGRGDFAVIDFGLSTISKELEERAIDIFLMEKSIGKDEYTHFVEGYKRCKDWKEVLAHMEKIRKRGRYWERGEEDTDDE